MNSIDCFYFIILDPTFASTNLYVTIENCFTCVGMRGASCVISRESLGGIAVTSRTQLNVEETWGAVKAHACGRLTGDQICAYVTNRFVIPSLKAEEFSLFDSGRLTLNAVTKAFIHDHLEYAYYHS